VAVYLNARFGADGRRLLMRLIAIKTRASEDLLLTTPALRALRRGFPKADLILLTGRANANVAGAIPGVDAYMFVDDKTAFNPGPLSTYGVFKDVSKTRAEAAFLFQPWPTLARLLRLKGTAVYAPFTKTQPPPYLAGGARWQANAGKYVAENYVKIAEAAGCARDDLRLDFVIPRGVPRAAEIAGVRPKKKYVALAPSGWGNPREAVDAKSPPERFFVEVVDFVKKEAGRQVVMLGGPQSRETCAAIAAKSANDGVINLAGKTDIFEAAKVIGAAAYLITVDALTLYVGVALEKPTLALFAPTNPKARLPAQGPTAAVAAELECAPCCDGAPLPRCRRPFKYECRERIPLGPVKEYILQREKK
jgi:ADP-heptose:LPS heptosyltransferase